MKRITALAALICLAVAVAVAGPAGAANPAPQAGAAASRTTKLKDSFFSPSRLTVARGTRIRFVWAGKLAHNMVGRGIPGSYAHTRLKGTLTRSFGKGSYTIVCTIHPGMTLHLKVR